MSSVRDPGAHVLLAERYGWTPAQVDELPDVALHWALDLLADS